jgi:glutamate racemase
MTSNAPIGVFDSGLGGISVVREIRRQMPNERIVYFGDSANAPYGTKPTGQVRELTKNVVDSLASQGIKALVAACNTASSAADSYLHQTYDFPIVEMEPALKVACDLGHGNPQRVIVAATELTLNEQKFSALMQRFSSKHTIYRQSCPDLVELVEHDRLDDRDLVMATLHRYFDQYDLTSIDAVVLGCTHFVFYRDYFHELVPSNVSIVDGNAGTVRQLHRLLEGDDTLAEPDARGAVKLENSDTSPAMTALMRKRLAAESQRS